MEKIPVKQLNQALSATLNGIADTGVPVLVTRHGYPSAVIVHPDHFTDLANRAKRGAAAAWWCSSCSRPVELGEEGRRSFSVDGATEPLCFECGNALEPAT